jgi:hypothetical protein
MRVRVCTFSCLYYNKHGYTSLIGFALVRKNEAVQPVGRDYYPDRVTQLKQGENRCQQRQ